MNRYDFEKYISSYIEGDLSPEEIVEFEATMEKYPECMEKYDRIKNMVSSLKGIPKIMTRDSFLATLHQRINQLEHNETSIFQKLLSIRLNDARLVPSMAFGTIALAFVVSSLILLNRDNSSFIRSAHSSNNEGALNQIENDVVVSNDDSLYYEDRSTDYEGDINLVKGNN